LLRGTLLSVIAVVLAGCMTSGTDYASVSQKLAAPKSGQARIVVFRGPSSSGAFDGGYRITLNGEPMKPLSRGTYFYVDRPAGKYQMTGEVMMFSGVTRFDFTVQPGGTYYFSTTPSAKTNRAMVSAIVGGAVGYAVAASIPDSTNPGPFDVRQVDEATAREAMSTLSLAD
jgi:hypothetical protein